MKIDDFFDGDYTGENRCWRCTIVNVGIVLGGSIALSWKTPRLAAMLLIGGMCSIVFRGYAIPYTPTLTKRYFPEVLLDWFNDGAHRSGTRSSIGQANLLERGIVRECPDEDDLCLSNSFVKGLQEAFDEANIRDSMREWIAMVDDGDSSLNIERSGETKYVLVDGIAIAELPSNLAIKSDLGIGTVCESWLTDWGSLTSLDRIQVLSEIRLFISECPECGSKIRGQEEEYETCCAMNRVYVQQCDNCEGVISNTQLRT